MGGGRGRSQCARHRPGTLPLGLVGGDRLLLLERERDVVEAVQEAVLGLRIDLERRRAARPADRLLREIDLRLPRLADRGDRLLVEDDRQQPDLRAVVAEDVGEARRDDRLEAVVLEAPGRVLPARSAPEIAPGDEDRVLWEVPIRLLGPVVEQELAEAGPLDPLEELLGHDLIGVDVVAVSTVTLPVIVSIALMRPPRPGRRAPTLGCRRNVLRSPPPRPSGVRRDASGRRGPGVPRSCGSRSRRRARRSRPPGTPRQVPPPRPGPSPAGSRGRPSRRRRRRPCGRGPSTPPRAGRRSASSYTTR